MSDDSDEHSLDAIFQIDENPLASECTSWNLDVINETDDKILEDEIQNNEKNQMDLENDVEKPFSKVDAELKSSESPQEESGLLNNINNENETSLDGENDLVVNYERPEKESDQQSESNSLLVEKKCDENRIENVPWNEESNYSEQLILPLIELNELGVIQDEANSISNVEGTNIYLMNEASTESKPVMSSSSNFNLEATADCNQLPSEENMSVVSMDSDQPTQNSEVKSRKRKYFSNTANPDLILKALDMNWKRQLVYRATTTSSNCKGDIYYTSPTGKKLRSMNEVETYLAKTNDTSVTVDCFSFKKCKLTDHHNESERNAHIKPNASTSQVTEDSSISSASKKVEKLLDNSLKKVKKAPKDTIIKHQKKSNDSKTKRKTNGNTVEDLNPTCGHFCNGYEGLLPDLMCTTCFCCFHPKCVNIYSKEEEVDFVCKMCQNKNLLNKTNYRFMPSQTSYLPEHTYENMNKKHSKTANKTPNKCKVKHRGQVKPKLTELAQPITVTENIVPSSFSANNSQIGENITLNQINNSELNQCAKKLPDTESNMTFGNCDSKLLFKIFRYLHTRELIKAKSICKTWNSVASCQSLWKNLYFQNLKVTNWDHLGNVLKTKNVESLNMQGVIFPVGLGLFWKEFNKILPQMENLHRLVLCDAPVSIIYRITSTLPNLKHFIAEGIFDPKTSDASQNGHCKFCIGKLAKLTYLETLKLRGIFGLLMREDLMSGNFMELKVLTQLQHIALTSFSEIRAIDLEFLKHLPNLTTLELGDCKDWTEEHYSVIGNLVNLKHLRLENGNLDASSIIGVGLKKLTNLRSLSLILFNVPDDFNEILNNLNQLQSLTLWSYIKCNAEENSLNIIKALKNMTQVKKFVWVLMISDIKKQFTPDGKIDDQFCCIPYFIKRKATSESEYKKVLISASTLLTHLRSSLKLTSIRVVFSANDSYLFVKENARRI